MNPQKANRLRFAWQAVMTALLVLKEDVKDKTVR
jgi:hypothetical protein